MTSAERLAKRIANLKGYTDRLARRPIYGGHQLVARSTTPGNLEDNFALVVGQNIQSSELSEDSTTGWSIEAEGNATFHNVTVRGSITAAPGQNKIGNSSFPGDVTGWTAGAGSITLETDPAQIDDGIGALKHTTPASAAETYVSGANVSIERDVPVRLTVRVKPAASGDSHRVALRWKDAAGTFISETTGTALTGVTGYQDIEAFGEPPYLGPTSIGSLSFFPGSDTTGTADSIYGFGTTSAYPDLWQNIDEGVLDAVDGIGIEIKDWEGSYEARTTITSGSLTGKTITSVQMIVTATYGFANAYIDPYLRIGATQYRHGYYGFTGGPGDIQTNTTTWTTNPNTGTAWTVADVENFRSGGANEVGIVMVTNNAYQLFVYRIEFKVNWTSGGGAAIPASAEPRLYTTPASGAGCITRWDTTELRPQPITRGGALEVDRLAVSRIGCHLRRSTNQSIAAFTGASISWNTEDEDTNGFIAVTGTTVTIPTGAGGLYDCTFVTKPQSGTSTGSNLAVSVSGAQTERSWMDILPNRGLLSFAGRVLAAGDTLVFSQYNNDGGAINYQAELWLYRTGV